MKIYVGDGILDVPEGPRNEILLRGYMAGFLCAMNLKIIIKNAAARWGGGK